MLGTIQHNELLPLGDHHILPNILSNAVRHRLASGVIHETQRRVSWIACNLVKVLNMYIHRPLQRSLWNDGWPQTTISQQTLSPSFYQSEHQQNRHFLSPKNSLLWNTTGKTRAFLLLLPFLPNAKFSSRITRLSGAIDCPDFALPPILALKQTPSFVYSNQQQVTPSPNPCLRKKPYKTLHVYIM